MKSIPLTKYQISAIANYLLGTDLPICVALHACYIEAEEHIYFADELDSVSKSYLDELIFKCALCDVWSEMFEGARKTMRSGTTPTCKICSMSSGDIFASDSRFLLACGIQIDVLTMPENMPLSPDIAGSTKPDCRLRVTDADLDFLGACGIRVRLSAGDAARRKLLYDRRKSG